MKAITSTRVHLRAALAALAVACGVSIAPVSRALTIPCGTHGPGGSWTSVGQSLMASRVQPEEIDVKPPVLPLWTFDAKRWTHQTGLQISGQPLVDGGCAYVGAHAGNDPQGRELPGWVFALNADTGEVVWQVRVEGGVHTTLALDAHAVYANSQGASGPVLTALDRRSGRTVWRRVLDRQPGSRAAASPVLYDNTVWVGIASSTGNRSFRGGTVAIDARSGAQLARVATRGGQSHPIAIDPQSRLGYVTTAAGELAAIELDRRRPTFGSVQARYRLASGAFASGATVLRRAGAVEVAALDTGGVLHVITAHPMRHVGSVLVGAPHADALVESSIAFDGASLYGAASLPGYVWSVDATTRRLRWLSPTTSVGRQLPSVSLANRVVYTVESTGFLDAIDAVTGVSVLHVPLSVGSETYAHRTFSSGGVTIAQHLVLVAVGVEQDDGLPAGTNGYVIAFGPAKVAL